MMIQNTTEESMGSLVELFIALRDDPRMNVGAGIVAIGRPEPEVPGVQMAHVRIGYDRGHSPFGEDKTFVVHMAAVSNGALQLSGGTYDLTAEQAWEIVSGRKLART